MTQAVSLSAVEAFSGAAGEDFASEGRPHTAASKQDSTGADAEGAGSAQAKAKAAKAKAPRLLQVRCQRSSHPYLNVCHNAGLVVLFMGQLPLVLCVMCS